MFSRTQIQSKRPTVAMSIDCIAAAADQWHTELSFNYINSERGLGSAGVLGEGHRD